MSEWRPYPWQGMQWQSLLERRRQRQLPHALLLTGPAGMGKRYFADCLAHALLCESPTGDGLACGQCRGCLLMQAGNHPDYLLVAPEEEGKGIGIDSIRALIEFQSLKSQYGGQRVVQLQPADRLLAAAANAVLKTLEEPVGDTVLLLVTDRPSALLPTVRSRCQQVLFRPLAELDAATRQWLQEQLVEPGIDPGQLLQSGGGAPLAALALQTEGGLALRTRLLDEWLDLEQGRASAVRLAETWEKLGIEVVMPILYGLLADMIRLRLLPAPAQRLTNPDLQTKLQQLAGQVESAFLDALLLRVQERTALLHRQVKPQVILEEILLAWRQRRV